MAKPAARRFSPEQIARMRWDYENTQTTYELIGEKYGITGQAVYWHSKKQGWVKYLAPVEIDEETERKIEQAAEYAHDAEMVRGLTEVVERNRPPRRKRGRPKKQRLIKDKAELPPGPSPPPPPAEPQSVPENDLDAIDRSRKIGASAEILPFPGGKAPEPKGPPLVFPTRTIAERSDLKLQLSQLRAVLSLQQVQQLERHEKLIADFGHMMQVYLTPHEYVDVTGKTAQEAEDLVRAVQRAAMSLLLPTERDSLAGSLKALTQSVATVVQLKRLVMGIAKYGRQLGVGNSNSQDEDGDETKASRGELNGLDLPTLRSVRGAMQVLTGQKAEARDPPKPPEPEPLDDLVVERPVEPDVPPR